MHPIVDLKYGVHVPDTVLAVYVGTLGVKVKYGFYYEGNKAKFLNFR